MSIVTVMYRCFTVGHTDVEGHIDVIVMQCTDSLLQAMLTSNFTIIFMQRDV